MSEKMNSTLLGIVSRITKELLDEIINKKHVDVDELKRKLKRRVQEEAARSVGCSEWKIRLIEERVREIIEAEKSLGNRIIVLETELAAPGLVGTSSGVLNAVMEVGISWDYILDLPLVPGSSVKGAFRSTLLLLCAVRPRNDKERLECLDAAIGLLGWLPGAYDVKSVAKLAKLDLKSIEDIAKRHAHMGYLLFHDTYLLCNRKGKLLEPHVLTPHYRDVKTEYDVKPTPVEHLVLAPGVWGVFIVGVRYYYKAERYLSRLSKHIHGYSCSDEECLVFLASLLKAVLESGVGARTSRGYSVFRARKNGVYMG